MHLRTQGGEEWDAVSSDGAESGLTAWVVLPHGGGELREGCLQLRSSAAIVSTCETVSMTYQMTVWSLWRSGTCYGVEDSSFDS